MNVEQKWAEAWNRAGMLPAALQLQYRARLKALRATARQRNAAKLPTVAGEGDEWEWDLTLANEVDKVWGAVTDQAGKVYGMLKSEAGTAVDATATGVAKLGFGVWPIALAVCALLYYYGGAKR